MNKYWIILILFISSSLLKAQVENTPADTSGGMGVAVSPSSFHLTIKPGSSITKEVSIYNDTKKNYKFSIGFADFTMGEKGEVVSIKSNDGKYTLSKWASVSPSYVELKPQERQKVKIIISIPDTAYFSAWTILTIDQIVDRPPLSQTEGSEKTYAFGIYNSMGFAVYLFQNPPNVKNNNIEIQKFTFTETDLRKDLNLEIKNVGDGIAYSASYAEITNLSNGKTTKLKTERFNLLPLYKREISFVLPETVEPGKYSAVGIVDFGSKEEIKAAELEFEIKKTE